MRSHRQPTNVHRNRHDDPGPVSRMLSSRAVVPAGGTGGRHAASTGANSAAAQPCLHPLPLCSPILEPDLHLHLGQLQRVRDVRSLGQTEVLLRVEFSLQFQQLLGRERRPSASGLVVAAAAGRAARRRALTVLQRTSGAHVAGRVAGHGVDGVVTIASDAQPSALVLAVRRAATILRTCNQGG